MTLFSVSHPNPPSYVLAACATSRLMRLGPLAVLEAACRHGPTLPIANCRYCWPLGCLDSKPHMQPYSSEECNPLMKKIQPPNSLPTVLHSSPSPLWQGFGPSMRIFYVLLVSLYILQCTRKICLLHCVSSDSPFSLGTYNTECYDRRS